MTNKQTAGLHKAGGWEGAGSVDTSELFGFMWTPLRSFFLREHLLALFSLASISLSLALSYQFSSNKSDFFISMCTPFDRTKKIIKKETIANGAVTHY
jgi:hypothetical protein